MAVPEAFKVNKLKEAFTASESSGEVSSSQFEKVLERLGVHASRLDITLLFDYIDVKKTDIVNYMQFYRVVKENMSNYPESTAQDLIINITMEHQMTQRGRKLRLEHKKRLNETKVPPKASSVPPVDEIVTPAKTKRNNLEPSPHVRGRRRSHEPSSRRIDEAGTRHRNTVAVALGPRRRLDLFDTTRRNSEPGIEESLDKEIDDFVNFGDSPRTKNRGRTKEVNKKKDDFDVFGGKGSDEQLSKALGERIESLDDTVRTLMIESQQSILEAIAQAAQQRTSDLSVVARDIRSLVGGRLGDSDVGSQIKEDIQRLAQKIERGGQPELDRIRADVRAIRDDHDPHINSEMQRSLESLEQSLSNVGDHVGFNLGTKLDHMEAKLSRILTTVAAKNPDQVKSLDPKTEAELRDERKRLREAIKFIEAQVKKFKQQKSDYKNQIRLESEKIRKERKLLSKEKDLLRKESASLESARSELKELRYQVSKAQRKLRKGSMMSADMSILNLHQDEEVDKLKLTNSNLTEQVQKLKLKFKEERSRSKQLNNELKSSNKRLDQEKEDLEQELVDVQDSRKKLNERVNELTTQVMDLNVQNEENAHRATGGEKVNKDELEKERAYLAKMKLRLQDLAQKLNDERDNNAVAHDLDKKAKNIATQMKLLSAEREALYSEREQFEAEKTSFIEDRAEKDQTLKTREDEIAEARKRTEAQAKIMKKEYPKFQGRLAKLEAEEKRFQEKAKELSELEKKLNTSSSDLTKKVEAAGKDRVRLNRESAIIVKREQELAKKDEKIKEMQMEVQKMKDALTLTKTTLRVKQDAFESLTRDFEAFSKKGGGAMPTQNAAEQTKLVEKLLQEETIRLQKEFAAEKKKLEDELGAARAKKGDSKAQKEAEFHLEKERIKYLAKELHAAMDDLEKQKVAFEGEKRNWLRVISELIDDEAVLKEIHKMFDKDNKDKGKGLASIPSPRVPDNKK